MTLNPNAVATTARGIYLTGVPVIFQRLTGYAPDVTLIEAAVIAKVTNVTADTAAETEAGISSSETGNISQNDRMVLVMASDLSAAGFPLPIALGDKVIIDGVADDDATVIRVDAYKRAMAGAIEVFVAGTE